MSAKPAKKKWQQRGLVPGISRAKTPLTLATVIVFSTALAPTGVARAATTARAATRAARTGRTATTDRASFDEAIGLQQRARDLRREISLYNLYNGLNLTRSQAEKLASLARAARRLRDDSFGKDNERYREIVATYERIRSIVAHGKAIPGHLEALGGLMELKEKEEAKRFFEGMAQLERDVVAILSPAQRKVFRGFDPCLVPPRNLKSPVNVGQASGAQEGRELLEQVRSLPAGGFDGACRRLLETHVRTLEQFLGPIEPARRTVELNRMVAVCRRAHGLDDIEFALEVDSIAEQLDLNRQKEFMKEKAEEFMGLVERMQGGRIGKTAKHFLDPLVEGILRTISQRGPVQSHDSSPAGLAPKKKYSVDELAGALELDGETKSQFHTVFGKAKLAHLKILQQPLQDGTTILSRFMSIGTMDQGGRASAGAALHRLMQIVPAGESMSPFEKLLRLKARLHRKLQEILPQHQYEWLTTQVPDLLDAVELDDNEKKRRVATVMTELKLDAGQRRAFEAALRAGKAESFRILSTPASNGKKPLEAIVRLQSLPPNERQAGVRTFIQAMQQEIPGRSVSYASEIERVKREVNSSISAQLSPRQRRAFLAMKLDILDLKFDDE